jgi:hypothetical protein
MQKNERLTIPHVDRLPREASDSTGAKITKIVFNMEEHAGGRFLLNKMAEDYFMEPTILNQVHMFSGDSYFKE